MGFNLVFNGLIQRYINLKGQLFHKLSKFALTERHIQQSNNKEENGGENKIFVDYNAIEREVNNDNLAIVKTTAMNFQQYS